jgi:hypothetical protein
MSRVMKLVAVGAIACSGAILFTSCASTSDAVDPAPTQTGASSPGSPSAAPTTAATGEFAAFMDVLQEKAPTVQFQTSELQAAFAALQNENASTNDPDLHRQNCNLFIANVQQQYGVEFSADTQRKLLLTLYPLAQ